MKDPYGELFEKHVQVRYPDLKFVGDGRAMPDFEYGSFFLEAKCANSTSGAHISYSQFRSKRHLSPLYIIGFHEPAPLYQSGVSVVFSPWYVVSNIAIRTFFSQTKYLRVLPTLLDRVSTTPENDYLMRSSTIKSPGLILHKQRDASAIDFFENH